MGSSGIRKLPLSFVVVVRVRPVPVFSTVTVAPATTPPDLSITSPLISPVIFCADRGKAEASTKRTRQQMDTVRPVRMRATPFWTASPPLEKRWPTTNDGHLSTDRGFVNRKGSHLNKLRKVWAEFVEAGNGEYVSLSPRDSIRLVRPNVSADFRDSANGSQKEQFNEALDAQASKESRLLIRHRPLLNGMRSNSK